MDKQEAQEVVNETVAARRRLHRPDVIAALKRRLGLFGLAGAIAVPGVAALVVVGLVAGPGQPVSRKKRAGRESVRRMKRGLHGSRSRTAARTDTSSAKACPPERHNPRQRHLQDQAHGFDRGYPGASKPVNWVGPKIQLDALCREHPQSADGTFKAVRS